MKNSLSVTTFFSFVGFVSIVLLLNLLCFSHAGDIQTLFQQQLTNSDERNKATISNNFENTGIDTIGIERTTCYGTCPAYSFIVNANGSFKYIGETHVEHVGEYTGTIATYRLTKVLGAIAELDFASYNSQYTSDVTDAPAVYTLVTQYGESKVIENYASVGPASLWAIEELIDSLIEQINWTEAVSTDSY